MTDQARGFFTPEQDAAYQRIRATAVRRQWWRTQVETALATAAGLLATVVTATWVW